MADWVDWSDFDFPGTSTISDPGPGLWEQKNGVVIKARNMTIRHINNAMNLIRCNIPDYTYETKYQMLRREKCRRKRMKLIRES